MPSVTDFPARGKVIRRDGRAIVFAPSGTNYELILEATTDADAPASVIDAVIRVAGRKVWTVPSGGNFIEPIYGSPRRVQGRIKYIDETEMVVHAGTSIVVKLPADASAIEEASGPLSVGGMVNVVSLPGGTIELLGPAVKKI